MASASPGEHQCQQTVNMEQSEDQPAVTSMPPYQQSPSTGQQQPFQCGLCSVTFDINVELVTHVHRHSLTKPYQCGYCKVSYNDNPALIIHVKSHALFMFSVPAKAVDDSASQLTPSHLNTDAILLMTSATDESLGLVGKEIPSQTVGADVSVKEIWDKSDSVSTGDLKETNVASGTVIVGSEMVVENSLPWKLEVMSEDESLESHEYAEVKTEQDDESLDEDVKLVKTNQGKKKTTGRRFCCDICDSTFKAARYVKDHKRRVHKISSARMCTTSEHSQVDAAMGLSGTSGNTVTDDCSQVSVSSDAKRRSESVEATDSQDGTEADKRPFPCPQCSFRFKTRQTLKDHIAFVHTDERPFQCTQCSMRFKRNVHLSRHVRYRHTSDRPFPCPQCSLCFKAKKTLKDHISFVHNNERPFPCSYCAVRCKTNVHLKSHVRNKHLNERPYHCTYCSARFNEKSTLSSHISSRHSGSTVTNDGDSTDEKPFLCTHCSARFKMKGTLAGHILIKHKDANSAIDDRPFSCPHCPWKFKGKFRLADHIARVHENQRPFPCPHCSTNFKSSSELSCHVNRKHTTETPHQCADCGRCFKVKRDLNQHFCKPKECPICKRMLNCLSTYTQHMKRKHSEDRFKCSHCELGFLTPRELEVHTRTHTKEKPFTCEICGQSFSTLANLSYHRNARHLNSRPYKCDICQKGFNSHPGLFQHKRRHFDDKRYSCDKCGKKFYQSCSLKTHALTHTDLRSFACSECGKTYRNRGNLNYHMNHSHKM
ncbi:zinc finger protein 93-like [Littorina saxatilis]|uniref:zinc finger protein 93-like n=1 Tax=Littorina saxatilis TaxID=31220 RepID=UPI0038B49749